MKRHHFVTLLLFVLACSGSTASKRGPWLIEPLPRTALDGLIADESESASAFFRAASEEREEEPEEGYVNASPAGSAAAPTTPGESAAPRRSGKLPIKTWRRSQLVPNTSKLVVGVTEELPLEATHVTVRIDGFRARVKLDLFYRNDRDKQLQGTLKLRLPDGAAPTATAFGSLPAGRSDTAPSDAPVVLKHARMVPRQKAAHAYGATVRRRIDPALVQWAGAGIYNVKVFPLEPGKLHRISISYDVDLTPVDGALEYRLDLPEKAGDVKLDFDVHATAHTVNGEPGPKDGRSRFSKPEERTFRIRIDAPGAIALTGRDSATGDLYAVRFSPNLPDEAGNTSERAIFLVDTSLSSNPERFNIWLDLMERILTRNRGTLREFRVGFFNIETHWWRKDTTPNTEKNVRDVMAYARTLALEGATDLGNAFVAAAAFKGDHDLFLLSDGAATWGERNPVALGTGIPKGIALFAYTTGLAGTDSRALRQLTRATGGAVFTVTGKSALDAASVAHARRSWQIVGIDAPGSDVLLRGRPTTLFPGQTLVAAGRGTWGAGSEIKLKLRQGEREIELSSKAEELVASPLTAGVYGQIAVNQLEEFGHLTTDVAKSYALHFRVVGKTCSLLMLDSEEDYQEYGISLPDEGKAVGAQLASSVVASALERRLGELLDPKARLAAWLKGLESMPGMKFGSNKHLQDALDALDADEINVTRTGPLRSKARLWSEMPGSIQEQFVSRKLVYDDVAAEAERRRTAFSDADGLKALSSLVEQNPGDATIARDVGFTALAWGLGADAYHLFRRIADARPYEPQSYVAMAQCLEGSGNRKLAKLWYEVALAGDWPEQFGAFREIATVHYISFLRRHKDDRLETLVPKTSTRAADLIVTIFWNTDRSDVDLHVRDADGEVCLYNHPETKMGGRITADVTNGFGPEMFVLEHARPGEYAAWVNYFAEDTTQASTRTKIYATVFENWGRPDEKAHPRTIVLTTGETLHPIARMTRR